MGVWVPVTNQCQLVEEDEEDVEMQDNVDDVDDEGDEPMDDASSDGELSSMIKSLVRYALACEFSRTPIRREGIREKGTIPSHSSDENRLLTTSIQ